MYNKLWTNHKLKIFVFMLSNTISVFSSATVMLVLVRCRVSVMFHARLLCQFATLFFFWQFQMNVNLKIFWKSNGTVGLWTPPPLPHSGNTFYSVLPLFLFSVWLPVLFAFTSSIREAQHRDSGAKCNRLCFCTFSLPDRFAKRSPFTSQWAGLALIHHLVTQYPDKFRAATLLARGCKMVGGG